MMYRRCSIVLLAASAFAQEAPKPTDFKPDTVVATINGQKITVREYEALLAAMTPESRRLAGQQPKQVLEQMALFQSIAAAGEKAKLDQESPFKERIAEARRQVLVQAQVSRKTSEIEVTPEQQKKFYDDNAARYKEIRAKVIFISQISETRGVVDQSIKETRTPEQSQKLATDIVEKLKAGEDFVALAVKFSDDQVTAAKGADFPDPIRPTSAAIPRDIRDAVLQANEGDIVGPLTHESGFYIFRVVSTGRADYHMVKDDIYKELKDLGLRKWLDETKAKTSVVIENESFFQPLSPAVLQN